MAKVLLGTMRFGIGKLRRGRLWCGVHDLHPRRVVQRFWDIYLDSRDL
jgi:hypothetical protein